MKPHFVLNANSVRFTLLILFFWAMMPTRGQVREVRSVPSPEVANLGTFGSIPVGHYTGTPNISVPLYTMKVGKLSIPIQAMYHTSNVKPHTPPTCLGIGWALAAGGYIARNVNGCQDEKETNKTQAGFYFNHQKLREIENSSNKSQQLQKYTHMDGDNWYELAADEFIFSFNGYSGTFFMDKEGEWRVISDDNIRVEFNNQNGFINFEALKSRIQQRYGFNLRGYNNSKNNVKFFDAFTLITPDGTRYEFGGGNATEYCIPYYNQVDGDIMATCWRLSRITTIDQRVVNFEYAADSYMCDIHYAPQMLYPYINNYSYSAYSGFLIMPSRLTKISHEDESINFNYKRDANYGYNLFCDKNSNCLYWISKNDYNRNARYTYGNIASLLGDRFCLWLNIPPTNNEYNTRKEISQKITQDYMCDMSVQKSNNKILKVNFSFNTKRNRKLLAAISFASYKSLRFPDNWAEFGNEYMKGDSLNSKKNISKSDYDKSESLTKQIKEYEYNFEYYMDKTEDNLWPERNGVTYTDSWGYYSRDGSNIYNRGEWSFGKEYSTRDFKIRPASRDNTLVFVLKDIVYPTGGKTTFEYELNDYSKEFNLQEKTIESNYSAAGGLRVSSIMNYDASGTLLYSKNYIYKNSLNGESSGISKGKPCFHDRIFFSSKKDDYFDFYSFDEINPYPLNFNTPSVGYSTVFEELKDGKNNLLKRTRYQYSNYDTDLNNTSHMDQQADYTANVYGDKPYAIAAFTSMAFERGKLISLKVMDANNNVLEESNYSYIRSGGEPYSTVSQECYLIQGKTRLAFSYLYKTYTNRYLVAIEKKQETMDNGTFSMKTQYEYTDYGLPSKEVISNSEGRHSTSYSYNIDKINIDNYLWMQEKNIIVPVSVSDYSGNNRQVTQYTYSQSKIGAPYISQKQTKWIKELSPHMEKNHTDYTVARADQYGNPIVWEEQGVKTIMIWSHKGQKLIASIENATYEEVEEALGKEPESYSDLSSQSVSLDFLRNKLSNSLVYTYQYDSMLNLIQKTEPNGLSYRYSYDSLGRLIAEYRVVDGNRELLNTYTYNYSTK